MISSAIPHNVELGMEVVEVGDGMALMAVPYADKLVGDPHTGVVHGGVLTALLDACSGTAVMLHPKAQGGTATIDLRIDYMRPAKPGEKIFARATCFRITRNVAFVRGTAFDVSEEEPVAISTGTFTVEPRGTRFGDTK
ncbi:MAG: PaaI family thioesterase [Pseudomonadota bacterium]